MKKIILASLIAISTQFAFAENKAPTADPAFAEVEAMVKANNMTGAYQALEKLGKAGNAQALYNLGYLTQTGQGAPKDEKKAIQLYEQSASKGYPVADYVLGKNGIVAQRFKKKSYSGLVKFKTQLGYEVGLIP